MSSDGQRRRCARNGKAGFGIAEVLIVMALLALLVGAIYRSVIGAMWHLRINRLKMAATYQVDQQIEDLRGKDYFRISGRTGDNMGFIDYHVNGTNDFFSPDTDVLLSNTVLLSDGGTAAAEDDVQGIVESYIEEIDDDWDGIGAEDDDGETCDYKKAMVRVTWSIGDKQFSREAATFLYGVPWDDMGYDVDWAPKTALLELPEGLNLDVANTLDEVTPDPVDADPEEVTIKKVEYNLKPDKLELKVEAKSSLDGVSVLTVEGYGVMEYDGGKYKFQEELVATPGEYVTVTSDNGGSCTMLVKFKD